MGGTISSLTSSVTGAEDEFRVDRAITGAYDDAMRREHTRGGFSGGYDGACGCDGEPKKLGGAGNMDLKDVSEYANSLNSRAKNRIIDSIIEAASKLNLKVEGKDTASRIHSLIANIPTGKQFKQDDALQAKTCAAIARAINSAYGSKIIDESLPGNVVCQQIAEVLSSLSTGMHTEFLSVYRDVQKVIKNLHILGERLTENMDQLKSKIASSEDAVVRREVQTNYDLNDMLLKEVTRQSQILGNLLNIQLMPSAKELSSLLKDKKDIFGVISKIDLKPGAEGFGRVISDTLKGLGLTANFALIIEKALKEVGMSMQEYKALKNVDALKSAVVAKGMKLSDDKLHEFNSALELLEKNLYRRQDIGTVSGSSEDKMSGSFHSTDEFVLGSYAGGAPDYPRSNMDKRVQDRIKLRNLVFQTFYRQLNAILDRFVGALDILSMKIGRDVPISDQLDGFRQALDRINIEFARKKQMYYALIGYYNDAMSRSKRDQVIADMRMVSSFIDSVLEMPMYRASAGAFQAVQAQTKALLDLIEKYSEEIAAKFGRGEIDHLGPPSASMLGDATGTIRGSAGPVEDGYSGGAGPFEDGRSGGASLVGDVLARGAAGPFEDGRSGGGVDIGSVTANSAYADPSLFMRAPGMHGSYSGSATMIGDIQEQTEYSGGIDEDAVHREPELKYRSTKTINDAIRQFDYKYRVAQIQANLARSGKELSHYSEKYEKLTAASLADILQADQKRYQWLRKQLLAEQPAAGNATEQRDAALKVLEAQWDAKKKFWSTVEAIDTYMRLFTNGFFNNLNDIKEIRSALDEVEIIRDWYTDASGNILSGVFDRFAPTISNGTNAVSALPAAAYYADDARHYYKTVEAQVGTGLPGVPGNVSAPVAGLDARNNLKRALSSMTALKNLLSVFVHFGSRFGGEELGKKIFLTPAQIYNNLMDYLQASAFAQGFGLGDASEVAGAEQPANWLIANAANQNAANVRVGMNNIQVGLSDNAGALDAGNLDQCTGLQRKRWGVWMRSVQSELKAMEGAEGKSFNFLREDEYFVLVMKSIAAKILTVTGMYDVIDRPYEYNGIQPIRMIMGGNSDTPKVEEGAVALYLRLPLLCQFWREIFGFEGTVSTFEDLPGIPQRGHNALKISMVPDIDGTFSGLIRLIFRKTKYLESSSFSDDDIKEIIRECNSIYQKMAVKHSQNTVMETIYELVNEVNRRYGIVSMADRDKYVQEFGYRYNYSSVNGVATADRYQGEPDPSEIAILPGEDEEEIQRPSAAERLLGEGFTGPSASETRSKFSIHRDHRELVYRFRCALDKYFENPKEEYSFNAAIKSTQMKLRRETRDEERFKIVSALVRGVDVYSKVDGLKYVMFHETVVAGLNTLSALHTLLARFQSRAQILDVQFLIDETLNYLQAAAGGGAPDVAGLTAHLTGKLTSQKVPHENVAEFLGALLGVTEADTCQTGVATPVAGSIRPTADMTVVGVVRFHANDRIAAGGVINAATAGLLSVLNGLTVADVRKSLTERGPTSETKKRAQCFFRYLFNREFIMNEILETIFGLGTDLQGLVDVRVDDGKLYMNHGGLKTLIEELFQHVGYFIDALRPHVRNSVVSDYTDKLKAGSLYWLQEQLLEKIIIGRPGDITAAAGTNMEYVNLDGLIRGLSGTYSWLTQEYGFNGVGLSVTNGTVSNVNNVTKSRNAFDKVFANMIFYDGERPASGLHASDSAPEVGAQNLGYPSTAKPEVVKYLTDPYEALHLSGPPTALVLDTRFAARFYQLYSWKEELTMNRSALFIFNQLVAKYIQAFYDPATKKMYGGLITQFANGTFNRAITDLRYTYPDIAPMVAQGFTGTEDVKAPPVILQGVGDPFAAAVPAVPGPAAPSEFDRLTTELNTFFTVNAAVAARATKALATRRINATNVNAVTDLAGALTAPTAGAGAPGWVIAKGAPQATNVNIIEEALKMYPYREDVLGNNDRESVMRITMLRDIIARLAIDVLAAINGKDAKKVVSDLASALGSRNVFSTGRSSALAYTVKYDDLLNLKSTDADQVSLTQPMFDEKVLLFARSDAVAGGPPTGSTKLLGISGDPANNSDDVANITQFGHRADPDGDHVLFTSLAVVIRNLVSTRTTQNQAIVYMHENVADVPLYMKEKMRANLPAFKNLFKELVARCEFLKKFLTRKEMNVQRHFQAEPTHNPWPWVLQAPNTAAESEKAKDRFGSILDTISRGTQTLLVACDQTLKEIGDDPKYFELYQNSMRDYKSQYGVDPLMPLSTVLATCKNVTPTTQLDLFPIHSLGERQFKWMYGTRGLLQNMTSQVTAESAPGWAQSVEGFNLMVDTRMQLDRVHVDGFLKSMVKAVRFIHDLKHIKGLITPHVTLKCANSLGAGVGAGRIAARAPLLTEGLFTRGDMVTNANGALGVVNKLEQKSATSLSNEFHVLEQRIRPVFAIGQDLSKSIALTESSVKDDRLKDLVEWVNRHGQDEVHNSLAVQNIIDLNIIPINVHALMREIPLANLYNYAYTYDRMVVDLYYGTGEKGAAKMIQDLCSRGAGDRLPSKFANINSSKDMLVALLLDPYLSLEEVQANFGDEGARSLAEYVEGMMLGAVPGETLGRPKYLSDQIYGKAIFGDLYASTGDFSDMGPAASAPRKIHHDNVLDFMAATLLATTMTAYGAGAGKMQGFDLAANATKVSKFIIKTSRFLVANQTATIDQISTALRNMSDADLPATNRGQFIISFAILAKVVSAAVLYAVNRFATEDDPIGTINVKSQMQSIVSCVSKITEGAVGWGLGGLAGNFTPRGGRTPLDGNTDAVMKHLKSVIGQAATTAIPAGTFTANADVEPANYDAPVDTFKSRMYERAAHSMRPTREVSDDRSTLKYLEDGAIATASIGDNRAALRTNGRLRFDTVVIRNLTFVVNLYRSVRAKLASDLVYSRDIVTRSQPITRLQQTEFTANEGYKSRDEQKKLNSRYQLN